MTLLETSVIVLYFTIMGLLALFGLHRLGLVITYLRTRSCGQSRKESSAPLPYVTVQLPIYNEQFVVHRLINSVAALDYPRDRLQIQVLDDSNDNTVEIAAGVVEQWRRQGLDIEHVRRPDRVGFKAGALDYGLATAKGEIIAIFDADFVPPSDFLTSTVAEFEDAKVGMVQARWGHLNAGDSLLTRVQATMLNGHFVVEHAARYGSGRFFNFNGTAGLFRRTCIESSGGWEHDTLTEDLDLSYRAQLAGWRFVYRPDVRAEAELPSLITAFKSQQFRWAKGSIQTARKNLWRIITSNLHWKVRVEACFHLLNNFAYLFLAILAVLLPIAVHTRQSHGLDTVLVLDLPIFMASTCCVAVFFLLAEGVLGGGWWKRALSLPVLFAVGIGICINNGRAVIEALLGHDSAFLRTPKLANDGQKRQETAPTGYRSNTGWILSIELAFAAYYGAALFYSAWIGYYASMPWLALFFVGFVIVGGASLLENMRFSFGDRFTK